MPVLKNLTFTSVPVRSHDPVAVRRAKLVSRLEEQRLLLQNPSYVRTVQRWVGKGDDRRQVEKQQRVRPWWRTNSLRQPRDVGLLWRQADRVREGQGPIKAIFRGGGQSSISTRIRDRSSRARPSPACSPTTTLRSAWTVKGLGGIMFSSSACGAALNTRRCICGPTTASARPALAIRPLLRHSTTARDRTRALTARHPIKPTSRCCLSAWQPNPGRRSTYRHGDVSTPGPPLSRELCHNITNSITSSVKLL